SAWAPVLGVYGVSAILVLGGGALVTVVKGTARERLAALAVLALPWLAAWPLARIDWTHAAGKPVSVAIVQGAIPQDQKWLDSNRDTTLTLYRELTLQALPASVIVWPEAAAPDLAENLTDYLVDLYRTTRPHGSTLVMGILRADADDDYFNS